MACQHDAMMKSERHVDEVQKLEFRMIGKEKMEEGWMLSGKGCLNGGYEVK
jgi:hypothetical protein